MSTPLLEPMSESSELQQPSAFRRLLRLGKPYLLSYAGLCALSLAVSAGNTFIAQILRVIVNAALNKQVTVLWDAMTFGIVLVAVMALCQFASDTLSSLVDLRSVQDLQQRLLQKLLRVPMKAMREYHSADLFNRLHDSANTAQSALNQHGVKLFRNATDVIMVLAYLLYVSAPLAAGAVVIAIVVPIAIAPHSKRIGDLYWQRQQAQAAEQAFVQESVQGMEVVKSLSLWASVQRLYTEKSNLRLRRNRQVLAGESILWRIQMLVFVAGMLYALGFGGYLVTQNRLDMGAIAGFLIAFQNLLGPIGELSSQWPQFQNAIAQSRRVFEILDLPEEGMHAQSLNVSGATPSTTLAGPAPADPSRLAPQLQHATVTGQSLTLCDVSFAYQSDAPVLKGLSLDIPAGQTTALVGPSGGGKSTIVQLLLRFFDPDAGRIRLGNLDIATLNPRLWRSFIGFVPQETLVFSGTVFDNILCGRQDASRTDVLRAADLARVTDFAQKMPQGFDTPIGERGLLLSGGERQRLALARAILRNPPILLLDEPTSALDSENESLVQEALDGAMQNRTTIVIAHRLSTIQHAQQIAFIQQGQVQELGSHQALIARRGAYFDLHQASQVASKAISETEED